jgi:hypothetical protein
LAGRTSVRAVIARLAGLVGAHCPTGVLHVRSHSDQTSIGGKLALPSSLLQWRSNFRNGVDGAVFMSQVV